MTAGKLVQDDIVVGLIRERLVEGDCQNGFILDGFPRTIIQAEKLTETLKEMNLSIDTVIDIQVGTDELVNRLTGRSTCSDCGAIDGTQQRLHIVTCYHRASSDDLERDPDPGRLCTRCSRVDFRCPSISCLL